MLKAELRPAGSFIQNTATTAASTGAGRRHNVRASPSRRAKSRATPAAAQQVPAAVQHDEGMSQDDVGHLRRPQRPGSAWKSRNRRPRFTDNFDAFDDPVIDLDTETVNTDDPVDTEASAPITTTNTSSSELKTNLDVGKPQKDLSQTPRAWQDNTAAVATSGEHQLNKVSKPADVYHRQVTNTNSENWTSSEETSKRDSVELVPEFQLSHIRAKVLEKYRNVSGPSTRLLTFGVSMSRSLIIIVLSKGFKRVFDLQSLSVKVTDLHSLKSRI